MNSGLDGCFEDVIFIPTVITTIKSTENSPIRKEKTRFVRQFLKFIMSTMVFLGIG